MDSVKKMPLKQLVLPWTVTVKPQDLSKEPALRLCLFCAQIHNYPKKRAQTSFLPKKHLFSRNDEGKLVENITDNFQDFNNLLVAAHARIGIRNWAITVSYNLLPYFKDKSSTQLNGLQLGLSISLF